MDARFYNSDRIDIERLASDLVNAYIAQGYQAQQLGNHDQMLVQIKKGGDFEAILGMQAALSLNLQRTGGGVVAMIGQQRWIDKAAVGAVGLVVLPILWPLALTAGVGALRQASLGNQVLNMVDGLVHQQVPGAQIGPVPYNLMPQVQQHWQQPPQAPYYAPPQQPAAGYAPVPGQQPVQQKLRCSNCNTPYEPGDTFCSGCGRSLTPPRQYCSKCNTEVKPGAAFCPRCGASTFSSTPPQSAPAPASAPSTTSYAPPAPPTPAAPIYSPPPAKPPTPTYTPPPTPTYTPSAQPDPHAMPTVPAQPDPHAMPTVPAQPTEKAETPYYVPPTPQTPSITPQPKVTVTQGPGTKKETSPAPPQRPEKVYYVPSAQPQQQTPAAEQPTIIPNAPWGTLVLPGGEEVQLKGERAIVGRYDNDVSGIQPDVDLSKQDGADTVSRIHAAIEHSGGTYTVTDLNSTNSTRVNGKRLDADVDTPVNDGDSVQFGKIVCTFKKA